jgi:two-component system CitB family sensor kinase/two-component system sensor histidine kinase DctS
MIGNSIKKSLLGLEPEHIVKLFTEQASMLDAIHEGIISIDDEGNITLINDSVLKILGITEIDISHTIGTYIEDVFLTSRLTHIIKTRKSEYDKEQIINGRVIVTNRVPIINDGEVLGAIATFRDKTDIMNLAEELTGINQIVDALRANSHEFLNKIHVILGLVQLGEYVEVEDRGIGIEKDVIDRIFDKGYSTKEGSNGTGLYLVKKTVNELDGSIEVDSEVG